MSVQARFRGKRLAWSVLFLIALAPLCYGGDQEQMPKPTRRVLVRDIATISGVRGNPLIGYGIVVGLRGTGDSQQTVFTTQTLAAAMQKFGVQFPPTSARVNNVAAVFVTAELPPFATPGVTLDVNVSSVGDARSLEGGVLLMTSLKAADGQVYALAQGPLTLGGYTASGPGGGGNAKMTNHSTVGLVPNGAVVERDTAIKLDSMRVLSFELREPDFTASRDVVNAINSTLGKTVARSVDSRRVDLDVAACGAGSVTELISKVQNIALDVHPRAKVIMNERTGTIVMGGDVTLSPVAVLHGNLSIEVTRRYSVSQPFPESKGETKVIPETTVSAQDTPAKTIRLTEGANVEDLISGLHAIGASARDIVAILQAIKSAGALQAELEVI